VLHGVLRENLTQLNRNVELFKAGQFQMQVTGNRYVYDKLRIRHDAGNDMCLLQSGEENQPVENDKNNPAANDAQDIDDSEMNE